MTTNEFIELILTKNKLCQTQKQDENDVYEVAQLISGSFIYTMNEALQKSIYDSDAITEHLENLYDTSNYYGLMYFIFMLADVIGLNLPIQFVEMTAIGDNVPIMAAAIIEDWLDYNF